MGRRSIDDKFLRMLQAGDDAVVGELYRRYRPAFIAWVQGRYDITEMLAADCFQDAVIAVWNNALDGKLCDLRSSLKTYLFSIGKHFAIKKLSKDARSSPWEEEYRDAFMEAEDDPEQLYLGNERINILADLVQQLNEPCRSIIRYYYYQRFTMEAIAEVMQYKNAATVKSQKVRCVKELRDKARIRAADL